MELSKMLRKHAHTIFGKEQLVYQAFAKALETIPRQVSTNAGFDSTSILNQLRHKHAQEDGLWYGVDVEEDGICNTFEKFVWEPAIVKHNSIMAATEAACIILSVDETIRNARSGNQDQGGPTKGANQMMNSNLVRSAQGRGAAPAGKGPRTIQGRRGG